MSTITKLRTEINGFDLIASGGLPAGRSTLVAGSSGSAKTNFGMQFLAAGIRLRNQSGVFVTFEEPPEDLRRNVAGWGIDFPSMEAKGLLKTICTYPESTTLEDALILIKRAVEEFQPQRVAVDSLSALERVAPLKSFREFVIGLSSFIKDNEIPALFTATTDRLLGGSSITEAHISTITDSIILLRYVELFGEIRRGLTVLKMRGSGHEKAIREFLIDNQGLHLREPFHSVSGILSGVLSHAGAGGPRRIDDLSRDDSTIPPAS